MLDAVSFNSRPSCDGRLPCGGAPAAENKVSIHARRATGDRRGDRTRASRTRFNSRPSCDGRPRRDAWGEQLTVSIHARRATGDRERARKRASHRVSIHARRATGDAYTTCLRLL